MKLLFFCLFAADAALNLYACRPPEKHPLRRASKLLLMPLLACWYAFAAPSVSPWLLAAILCGFVGDAFLLPQERTWTFLCGLIAFAGGHVCYSAWFFQRARALPPVWAIVAAAAVYLAGIACTFRCLWPRMPKHMFAPCLAYMLDISVMSFAALTFALSERTGASLLCFAGSLLFIASDTALSFSTFRKRIPYRYLIVMSTYIFAQLFLVAGAVLSA